MILINEEGILNNWFVCTPVNSGGVFSNGAIQMDPVNDMLPTVGLLFVVRLVDPGLSNGSYSYSLSWSLRSGSPSGPIITSCSISAPYTRAGTTLTGISAVFGGGSGPFLGGPEAFLGPQGEGLWITGGPSGINAYDGNVYPIPSSAAFAAPTSGSLAFLVVLPCFDIAVPANCWLVCDNLSHSVAANNSAQVFAFVGSRPEAKFTTTVDEDGLALFDASTSVPAVFLEGGATLTDPYTTIVSESWDFNDGTVGTGVTPSHLYESAGTYNPVLTVQTNYGNTNSITHGLSVTQHLPALAHNPQTGALHFVHCPPPTTPNMLVATNLNQASFTSLGKNIFGSVRNGRLFALVADDILYITYCDASDNRLHYICASDNGQFTQGGGQSVAFVSATNNPIVGVVYDASLQSLVILAVNSGGAIQRVCFKVFGYGGASGPAEGPSTVTGLPSNIKPGRLFYDGTTLLLCAKSGADLNLYQSIDDGLTWAGLAALTTGYAYLDAAYGAHTGLTVLLRDNSAGLVYRLAARHNGAGAWVTEAPVPVSGIPAGLGGMALCAFNDTHMQANKLTSTIALRQSIDELFSFASL